MEITTENNKNQKIVTRIQRITHFDFTSKAGNDTSIVILHTTAGKFTNYRTKLDAMIDIELLTPETEVEISYKTFTNKTGKTFKNFTKINLKEK